MRRNTNRHGSSDAGVETGLEQCKAVRHSFNFDSLSLAGASVTPKRFLPERVLCSLSGARMAFSTGGWKTEKLCPIGTLSAHHSENKETVRPCSRWESICRPTGEGTEQEKSKTDLLNRERSNATVLTRPRQQPRVGLVKPSPVRQAVKLLPRRIAECWKQHGYRQRDHLLSTNTRYFPLYGGSSAVFKPLSTQDHSLPTSLRRYPRSTSCKLANYEHNDRSPTNLRASR